MNSGPSGSNAATFENDNLSPPPQPEEVKIIEAEAQQSKHSYPVAVSTADDVAVAPAAPFMAPVEVIPRQLNTGTRFAGKSKEEVAAIKIQTAFRVYMVCASLLFTFLLTLFA